MRKRSELIFTLALLPIDFLAVISAFVLAFLIRTRLDHRPVANPIHGLAYLKIFLLLVPVWILIFALTGLYNLVNLRSRWEEMGKVFVTVSGGAMFVILVDFVSRQPIFPSKSVPIYAYGLSLVLVLFARQVARSVRHFMYRYGVGVHNVVLVGSGPIAKSLAKDMESIKSGYRVIGAIDTAEGSQKRLARLTVYQTFTNLLKQVGEGRIDEIIQADSALGQDEVMELVNYASDHHLVYRFVPNQFGLYATNAAVGTMAGQPMVEIRQTPLEGWGRILKRGFDLVGSALGLVVLSPVFLVIAILMKLTDRGPVFYSTRRLSRGGEPISIHKFRSMYAKYSPGLGVKNDEESFAKLGKPDLYQEFRKENKLAADPRVMPLGRFLRRTSLDELPQLWNVLKGDLSLVGPRPMFAYELDRYGGNLPQVLALRCGVTGLWQVSGRTDIGFEGRVKLDLYYVENWSLWLDIKILLKSVLVILKGKGAY